MHQANSHESKTLVQRAWRMGNEWRQTTAHKPLFSALLVRSLCVHLVCLCLKQHSMSLD